MSALLWTSDEAAAATGGFVSRSWTASGVSIDSRTVQPGDLFVALTGPNFDGHDFVATALAAGAGAAVAHRRPVALAADAPLLIVADTLEALGALGRRARDRSAARFVALTGSVGKTGTKEALRLALSGQGRVSASEGNLNNHWGAPLSLARMPSDADYGVFELGMNHAGEIAPLSRLVRPHVAVITTVEPVHLEFFPSVEAIADAKAEIFEGVEPDGVAVLNRDNRHFDRLAGQARDRGISRILGFGEHAKAEARLVGCRLDADGSEIEADLLGERISYRLTAPGRHLVQNSLAVLAAVKALGADAAKAAPSLLRWEPLKGRGRRLPVALAGGTIEIIDESYNASPAAVRAALEVLGRVQPGRGGRRVAVLGDMRELGDAADRAHADLARDVAAARVSLVLACGPHMAQLVQALPTDVESRHTIDSAALTPMVLDAIRPGDVILVKGSLGSRMAPIVEALRALALKPAANGR
jgi:UDP-N-acetylmuramoyl-tripeptide--D-alanyl-D-alanine ligase